MRTMYWYVLNQQTNNVRDNMSIIASTNATNYMSKVVRYVRSLEFVAHSNATTTSSEIISPSINDVADIKMIVTAQTLLCYFSAMMWSGYYMITPNIFTQTSVQDHELLLLDFKRNIYNYSTIECLSILGIMKYIPSKSPSLFTKLSDPIKRNERDSTHLRRLVFGYVNLRSLID